MLQIGQKVKVALTHREVTEVVSSRNGTVGVIVGRETFWRDAYTVKFEDEDNLFFFFADELEAIPDVQP